MPRRPRTPPPAVVPLAVEVRVDAAAPPSRLVEAITTLILERARQRILQMRAAGLPEDKKG